MKNILFAMFVILAALSIFIPPAGAHVVITNATGESIDDVILITVTLQNNGTTLVDNISLRVSSPVLGEQSQTTTLGGGQKESLRFQFELLEGTTNYSMSITLSYPNTTESYFLIFSTQKPGVESEVFQALIAVGIIAVCIIGALSFTPFLHKHKKPFASVKSTRVLMRKHRYKADMLHRKKFK